MSVEAGGELTFERVQMESGGLTVDGVVSLMESSVVEVVITGSSGSELSVSGGTENRSELRCRSIVGAFIAKPTRTSPSANPAAARVGTERHRVASSLRRYE